MNHFFLESKEIKAIHEGVMKRDLYLEWINHEVLEKGFQEPLWSEALQAAGGDTVAAKVSYLEKRRAQLIQENFKHPLSEEGEALSRVPYRRPPPADFIDRHPTGVRLVGFAISASLILFGFWMIRHYGFQ